MTEKAHKPYRPECLADRLPPGSTYVLVGAILVWGVLGLLYGLGVIW